MNVKPREGGPIPMGDDKTHPMVSGISRNRLETIAQTGTQHSTVDEVLDEEVRLIVTRHRNDPAPRPSGSMHSPSRTDCQ